LSIAVQSFIPLNRNESGFDNNMGPAFHSHGIPVRGACFHQIGRPVVNGPKSPEIGPANKAK
jgi:hypothetical protein